VNDCEIIEHEFRTRIFNHLTGNPQPGMDVRYTVLNPKSDTMIAGNDTQAVVTSDLNGEVAVTVEAPTTYPCDDPMKVLVEILFRDDMDICDGREFVIGCATVTKCWDIETLTITPPNDLISCLESADNLTGTFSVTNLGPPNAEDVTLTVDYPQEQGITVVNTDGGTDDGDKITWDIGILQPGDASGNPTFAASSGGAYTFTAATGSKCTAAGPVTWTVRVIEVTATCLINPTIIDLDPGEVFPSIPPSSDTRYIATYTLTAENIGGETVDAVLGMSQLPTGLRFEPIGSGEPESIRLEPGRTHEKIFRLKGIVAADIHTLTATVDISSATDPTIICNPLSTECNIEVLSGPAMQVEKVDTADPISVGHLTRYRMVVWNEGTADAYGVEIKDTLPSKMSLVMNEDDLRNNPDLDPRDLYLVPDDPAQGLHPDNVVVCKVELVIVDYATGNVLEDLADGGRNPIQVWDGPFNRVEAIEIAEGLAPELLSGSTTLTIDATGNIMTFTIDTMKPTWAFRISYYAKAEAKGSVNNITELIYSDELNVDPYLPEDGPSRSDEPTTIR
jgi:uncharacterized repeat protein (TIGR01451 family)